MFGSYGTPSVTSRNLRYVSVALGLLAACLGGLSLVRALGGQPGYTSIVIAEFAFAGAMAFAYRQGAALRPALASAILISSLLAAFGAALLVMEDANLLFRSKAVIVIALAAAILTMPDRHLGKTCIAVLLAGLLLVFIDAYEPPWSFYYDATLRNVFVNVAAICALAMVVSIFVQFRSFPIKTKLITVVLLVGLLPVLVLSYLHAASIQRQLQADASEKLTQNANLAADAISRYLSGRAKTARLTAMLPQLERFLDESHDQATRAKLTDDLQEVLRVVAADRPDEAFAYALLDRDGVIRFSTEPDSIGKNAANQYFNRAVEQRTQVFTPALFPQRGLPSGELRIYTPLIRKDDLHGILCTRVNLQFLERILFQHRQRTPNSGEFMVVDEYGLRIGSTHAADKPFTSLEPLKDSTIDALRAENRLPPNSGPSAHAPPGLLPSLAGKQDLDLLGPAAQHRPSDEVVAAAASVSRLPWQVVYWEPFYPLFQPLREQITVVLFTTMVVGLIVVALAIALAHHLSRPIVQMTDAVMRVNEGNLDVTVTPQAPDELGDLAHAFNSMTHRLRIMLEGLERRVNELNIAGRALQRSEEELRILFEHAPIGMALADLKGNILDVNKSLCDTLGYQRDELIGRPTEFVSHPEDVAETRAGGQRLIEGRIERVQIEKRYLSKEGNIIYVVLSMALARDSDGEPLHFIAQVLDVTEGYLAREALRQSEQHARERERERQLIFEHAPIGMATASPEGVILATNRAFREMLRYTSAELHGRSFEIIYHPEDAQTIREMAAPLLNGETDSVQYERRFVRRTGDTITAQVGLTLLRDDDGSPNKFVAQMLDLTDRIAAEQERRELERQMLHSQKLESLGVLAGGIAHDFNNLLVGIMGNAGLALMDLPEENTVRESIQHIETAAMRASELTRQLLAYSGKGQFVVDQIDLEALVREMFYLLEVSVAKNITINFNFDQEMTYVEGDPTKIRQVVMNLITNASDAIGADGGVIEVYTGRARINSDDLSGMVFSDVQLDGDYVYLSVQDTGSGMDPATISRIFDPFFTTKFTGRGLGLAAVIGIVRSHQGAIRVESIPDVGTDFTVYFPAATSAQTIEQGNGQDDDETFEAASGTILVVDDEEMVRQTARHALERFGFSVLTADDGRQGIAVFDSHAAEIDAVLLDMTMPHMDGEQTFYAISERDPSMPVIIISGFDERDTAGRFPGRKPAAFIQKPYRPTVLIKILRDILAERSKS